MERPTTPPAPAAQQGHLPRGPITPEQLRRIEINRMKAKAIREQREAEAAAAGQLTAASKVSGVKRSFNTMTSTQGPSTLRDAANNRPLESIKPARAFSKYVEYEFSKMTDTKGGFLTQEDDPHNKALHVSDGKEQKPANMTQKEWERKLLLEDLRRNKTGPFEPGLSVLDEKASQRACRECGSLEIDWKWEEAFKCCVCNVCKDKFPEKYSMLTKTEAREDYLLTDPELKDEELLPHLKKPNPHKSTWNDMMLYLRFQVEEYAFSSRKWGSPEALDAEFERREAEKKRRREVKFKQKLTDLKKRTRVEAYRRNRQGPAGGNFGDDLGGKKKHVHEWGRQVENPETGMTVKTCVECGMEVEELEL
ncbi:hypothetical protein TCE0_042f15331 [Talaromyces pinophilus]|uniref:DNA repair protein RAD14 n=1 Tax=Talaromyces pinophilus TaxID=128442 RepID=A0A6V8HJA3_TALPI|nr:hypothetical protein TCE0_042f15331 [Talaromyces pinophilus]